MSASSCIDGSAVVSNEAAVVTQVWHENILAYSTKATVAVRRKHYIKTEDEGGWNNL